MADEQIGVQQPICYVFKDWGEIIFDEKWLFWLPSIPCISLSLLLAQQELGVMGFLPFKKDGRRHFVSGSPGGN